MSGYILHCDALITYDITAVILAGGKQTRLNQIGFEIPKALAPFGNRSLIEYQVKLLLKYVSHVVIAGGQIAHKYDNIFRHNPRVSINADDVLGTGNALINAGRLIKHDHILVCNADTINDLSFSKLIHAHMQHAQENIATIALTRKPDVQNPGMFAVDSTGLVIRSFEDGKGGTPPHPGAEWHGASTGVIIICRKLLSSLITHNIFLLEKDIIPKIIEMRKLYAFDNSYGFSLDIGVPERLIKFFDNEWQLRGYFDDNC